jgi:glycosyl hydrolase family 76
MRQASHDNAAMKRRIRFSLRRPVAVGCCSCLIWLLALSGAAPADQSSPYAAKAREVTEHIRKTFYDPKTGVYLKSLTIQKPDYVWLQSVMFANLVAAARSDPKTYRPVLDKYFAALEGYWDPKVKIPGYEPAPTRGNGSDKYYDDNAWLVITFLEAYETNHNPRYLARADQTLRFVLSGWDDEGGGGIWWHQAHKDGTKNACANGPAAVGCLRLAKFREAPAAKTLIEQARKIVAWTVSKLQAQDGLFDDRIIVASGEVKRGKLTYNSALMLRAMLGLYRATGEKDYLDGAKRIGKAADSFLDKQTGVYRDAVRYCHFMVEADLDLHRTTGDDYLLARAKKNADAFYDRWKAQPPDDMISNAAIARVLWLMAETETDAGRAFWRQADSVGKSPSIR